MKNLKKLMGFIGNPESRRVVALVDYPFGASGLKNETYKITKITSGPSQHNYHKHISFDYSDEKGRAWAAVWYWIGPKNQMDLVRIDEKS